MNYKIMTIPHAEQRYSTVGDYTSPYSQYIKISVSDMTQAVPRAEPFRLSTEEMRTAERYEFLITIHELVEGFLCHQAEIAFSDIDKYDMNSTSSDPGAQEDAPYHIQHVVAEHIEKFVAQAIGVDWDTYSAAVDSLFPTRSEQETHVE